MKNTGCELERCPKPYKKWTAVIAGMVFVFFAYLVFLNVSGQIDTGGTAPAPFSSTILTTANLDEDEGTDSGCLLLTEHTNENGDYEKPVCKRLEETSERYDTTLIQGEI